MREKYRQDVRKHYKAESRVWMTYRNGVYDVTDFIAKHPGAQNIMLAAGGDVQPFWDIYSVHKGNEQARLFSWICYCGISNYSDKTPNRGITPTLTLSMYLS